jgi:hypothetical protein
MQRISDRVAYAVLLVLGALCMITFLVVRVPRAQANRVLTTDGVGYFSYLRSLIFDRDLDFHNEYESLYWDTEYTEGAKDVQGTGMAGNSYSIGPAILWAPFYVVAHLVALTARVVDLRVDATGYGLIYQCAAGLSTIAYVTVGSCLSYRVCRKYFSPWISLLSVSGLWFASSLLHYTVSAGDMAHGVSFFAVSLFLFLWHPPRTRTYREWALLGVSAGLMPLVRWQNVLYLSMLAVEAVHAVVAGRDRRPAIVREYVKGGFLVGLLVAVVFSPQMLAWNTLFGSYVLVPPQHRFHGEFDLLHPQLLQALFSLRGGWYTWTPVMLLATLGLVPLWRRDRIVTGALVVPLLLLWYVNSAGFTLWPTASFGARTFVSATALLSLGMAATAQTMGKRSRRGTLVVLGAVMALVVWNILFDLQYSWGFIPRTGSISLYQITIGKVEMILDLLRRATRLL